MRALAMSLLALAAGALGAEAQGLADFDYENLQARGVSVFVGRIFPSTVEPATSFGARIDLGYLGPAVRVVPGFTLWSSRLRQAEVSRLESQLAEFIDREQGTGEGPTTVDLGVIEWSDLALNVDGQLVWSVPFNGLTYFGAGVAAHILNGAGPAIDDTFVEDLLDRVAVGANLHAGAELLIGRQFRLFGEGRAELVENIQYLEARGGFALVFRGLVPGELRLSGR